MGDLLSLTDNGLYCEAADVYIDPWQPVRKALITHGHADHSRPGHKSYISTHTAKPVIKYRLGRHIKISSVGYGESFQINGVQFSFHPAGHIPGSAQIRVEHKGEVWVASGDYKLEDDGLSEPFEPVRCHTFITESTFGLPVFRWEPQEQVMQSINDWWRQNRETGKVSLIGAYALGKAQRILHGVDPSIGPIYTHGAVENINQVFRAQRLTLPETRRIANGQKKKDYEGALVVATPGGMASAWVRRFGSTSTAFASGWMQMRGTRRRRAADRGFVLSDHADWPGLVEAIRATEASRILVTHGYTNVFTRWLRENGWQAEELATRFTGESEQGEDMEES